MCVWIIELSSCAGAKEKQKKAKKRKQRMDPDAVRDTRSIVSVGSTGKAAKVLYQRAPDLGKVLLNDPFDLL